MKRSATAMILTGIIIVLAAALVGVLIFLKNQPPPTRGIASLTEIAQMEPVSEQWGLNFPNQYSTLLKTETNQERTAFGGSLPFSKLEDDPRLLTLFAGYGFSIEYNEDRGHLNTLEDVQGTARVNDKTPGTCYSCKSSDNPRLWDEMGMAEFDKTPFSALGEHMDNPIGCANCHEANTMRLVVTNPALEEALQAQGVDWRTFTRQEMRTVVCANCHVEYYFAGEGKYLTFPWLNGTNVDDIAEFYAALDFKDWEHPQSGTAMIKMQHPEYEFYTSDSTHYNAGVACGACHTDVTYVTNRVSIIQGQVHATLLATEDALVEAIGAIEAAAAAPGVDANLLAEARQLHREAQLRWDFIAAENSMGFHNPEEALRTLALATNQARQAQLKAVLAAGTLEVIEASSQ